MYVGLCVNVETKTTISFYYFSFTQYLVVCPFYSKKLKRLPRGLIGFLRFPECPFLLHGVEHSVAILSLVLVQKTDDIQCQLFYFMCTYRKNYNM